MDFITENIFLLLVAFVSGAALVWPLVKRGSQAAALPTQQAIMLVNKEHGVFVDVREQDAWAAGHIVQARHVPLSQLENRGAELPKAKPVVLVCETGRDSAKALDQLKKAGFEKLAILQGGMASWRAAGLPISRD